MLCDVPHFLMARKRTELLAIGVWATIKCLSKIVYDFQSTFRATITQLRANLKKMVENCKQITKACLTGLLKSKSKNVLWKSNFFSKSACNRKSPTFPAYKLSKASVETTKSFHPTSPGLEKSICQRLLPIYWFPDLILFCTGSLIIGKFISTRQIPKLPSSIIRRQLTSRKFPLRLVGQETRLMALLAQKMAIQLVNWIFSPPSCCVAIKCPAANPQSFAQLRDRN